MRFFDALFTCAAMTQSINFLRCFVTDLSVPNICQHLLRGTPRRRTVAEFVISSICTLLSANPDLPESRYLIDLTRKLKAGRNERWG